MLAESFGLEIELFAVGHISASGHIGQMQETHAEVAQASEEVVETSITWCPAFLFGEMAVSQNYLSVWCEIP